MRPASLPAVLSTIAALAAVGAARQHPAAVLESLNGEQRRLPIDDLDVSSLSAEKAAFLTFEGLRRAESESGERCEFELSGGERLVGELESAQDDSLRVDIAPGASLELAIDDLWSLRFPNRLPRDGSVTTEAAESGDRLYLVRPRGIDRLDGLLESFGADGLWFESRVGARNYPWSEVGALYLEPLDLDEDDESAASLEQRVQVDLQGGSRLRGQFLRATPSAVVIELSSGVLRIPPAEVALVARDDASFAFLSSIEPSDRGPISPFDDELGMTWPPQLDAAVGLGPMRAGGRLYTRGVGVHAPSRVSWQLDGAWSTLRTAVAVDDEVRVQRLRGSVIFRVLVDGEERHATRVMRGGDAPLALPSIDLEGARELTLVVDPTDDGWFADRADWLRPVLVAAQ